MHTRIGPDLREIPVDEEDFDYCDEDDYDDELDCTWCRGEGIEENDDPLWWGFDRNWIPCQACRGTGLRKHQTIF